MIDFACASELDDHDCAGVSPAKATKNKRERRGDVLEVARELLADGCRDSRSLRLASRSSPLRW
jgi:hypothetical protein